ncbi:phenylacetate--CoA ligase family protein [Zobellia amurskyensis]|uniref:Phenylacetate--CoA ligase family protein n=1 Tax=Zobellia amurskyensis TaxID=248905 RepID=A0A7X3D1G7_9FLAO|nr:phenylacetate--CoA ligase family protein [Zobellia amurskyensis]MUH35600.1 phenylacetate--CoA ligase family protein [Zobellia amurskyensis]
MKNSFSKAVFSFKTKFVDPKLEELNRRTAANLQTEDLSDLNLKKRKALVNHAFTHSEFYKRKYQKFDFSEAGVSNDDFLKLPPLTREELRENFSDIKTKNVSESDHRKASTSGSTGFPISVLHDRRHPETPIRWRILDWWGIEPWENQAFVYRYKRPFLKRLRNSLLWWPTKRIFLAAADLNEEKLNKFVRAFNRIKPTLLQGYVDVIFEFALYLLDNNIKIHPPKMVWVTSAPLFEEQRKLMEKAFGAPVCDQYGNTEILLIAAECPEQNGLHIMQDTVHIEFVDENNQLVPANTNGKILLTDLTNYAFPLIRYEIGDEGKYLDHSCTCGIPLPLMDNVRGRQSMNIQTPSGLRIRGEHLMAMFNEYMTAFKEIQLRQETDYSVCINYVPRIAHKEAKDAAQKMVQMLKKRSRSEIEIKCNKIEHIERKTTKTPLIVSYLG